MDMIISCSGCPHFVQFQTGIAWADLTGWKYCCWNNVGWLADLAGNLKPRDYLHYLCTYTWLRVWGVKGLRVNQLWRIQGIFSANGSRIKMPMVFSICYDLTWHEEKYISGELRMHSGFTKPTACPNSKSCPNTGSSESFCSQ